MATSNIKTIALTTPQKIEIVEAVLDQIRKQSIDVPNVEKVTDAEGIDSITAVTASGEIKRLAIEAISKATGGVGGEYVSVEPLSDEDIKEMLEKIFSEL